MPTAGGEPCPPAAATRVKERLALVFDVFPTLVCYRDREAGALSGGEQQMVAIGRALMTVRDSNSRVRL